MKIPTDWGEVNIPFQKLEARLAEELPNVDPVQRKTVLKEIVNQAMPDALLQSLLEATAVLTGQAEITVPILDAQTGQETGTQVLTLKRRDVAKHAEKTSIGRLLQALLSLPRASKEPKSNINYQLLSELLSAIGGLPANKQTKTALAAALNLGSETTKSGLTMLGRVLDRLRFPAEHRKSIEAINDYGLRLLFSRKVNSRKTRNKD